MFWFKFYYFTGGGHTHVRVFAGKSKDSCSRCGDLCFRNEEWKELRLKLEAPFNIHNAPVIEIIEEESASYV